MMELSSNKNQSYEETIRKLESLDETSLRLVKSAVDVLYARDNMKPKEAESS